MAAAAAAAAASSLTTPKLTFPSLQSLYRKLPLSFPLSLSSSSSLPLPKTLTTTTSLSSRRPLSHHRRRHLTTRAEAENGAEASRHYDFDLFTIGAGSGGVRASRFAANFGASVAVCELPFSTVSSETTGGVGGTCVLRGCVPKKLLVYASKYAHEFDESRGFGWKYDSDPLHDWDTLMANKNAELQRLTGIYKNILNNAVDVDGKLYSARHILISVGGRPFIPDIPGSEYNLGLESVGVKMTNNGAIEVDEYSCTSVPSIWAVGDVTDRINLTPVALMEGVALAKTLFQNEPTKPDYRAVPSAVFSQPPIGQVGITEEQATKEHGDIDVFTANFRPLKATLSGLPDRVFMKLIVCAKTNKVLGLNMCGEDSPEIVQGFAVAIKAGLTKEDFDSTVGIHPTAAEEFVTMRTPTRKIREHPPAEGKTDHDVKAAAGV
uniref:Glutathione-disulfide reductase n=1 Tax=Salix viminalis TaxID=40686 RepID=A0A6N2KXY3_SALVM